ncbi:hypothetical protein K438DRAFT_1757915 [Mycena galopus ATCC 62051]|nr:hypothetical protein K438DRAFT_1757915 [Mycena galopus ATCC 62051]
MVLNAPGGLDIQPIYYSSKKLSKTVALQDLIYANPIVKKFLRMAVLIASVKKFLRMAVLIASGALEQGHQILKLEAYKADINEVEPSGQSTPESHDSRESRDSRPGSRTRRMAPVALPGLVQVTQHYRHGQQSLDFSMGGRSGGRNQSIEEEMKHYQHNPWENNVDQDVQLFTNYAAIQATSVLFKRMLKFNYKKSRLNLMSEWESATVADDDEGWLRVLVSTTDNKEKQDVRREISDSCDFADILHFEMLEEQNN